MEKKIILEFSENEIKAILELISRADMKGQEAIPVALIINKFNNGIKEPKEPKEEKIPEIKK